MVLKQLTFLLALSSLFLSACNTTRIVKPLEKGEVRIGADLFGPFIGNVPIPLSSLHVAYGLSERVGLFGGLQTTSLLFQAVHIDLGANLGLLEPQAWRPGVSANVILNPIFGIRDSDFRLYPQIDINAYWILTEKMTPYIGLTNFLDIQYKKTALDKGSFYHPAINLGINRTGRKWIWGIEAKALDFNKQILIPQVEAGSIGGKGGFGIYLKAAYKIK